VTIVNIKIRIRDIIEGLKISHKELYSIEELVQQIYETYTLEEL
jgi:hypothetical protein